MRYLLICAVLLFAPSAQSEILGIEKGQQAPFDGVLIDKETAVKIISSGEYQKEECKSQIEYEVGKATNSCMLDKGILQAKLDSETARNEKILALREQEIDRLNKQLGKASGNWAPAWFVAGTSIGIATSIVIFFISVQTVNNTDVGQL